MGEQFNAVCSRCGQRFAVRHGGGLMFHLLHCERCGRERAVPHGQMGDTHLAYLDRPDAGSTGDPAAEEQFLECVEEMAGRCACGGRFLFSAPPRCPRCRSADYRPESDESVSHYR